MRALQLLVFVTATMFGGCFVSPDENKIDVYGTDTGCEPGNDAIEGMGDSCQADSDCPAGAPYCFTNPMDTTQNGCTIKDCAMGACPTCHQCCDCSTAMPGMIVCLPDDQISSIPEGLCTCG